MKLSVVFFCSFSIFLMKYAPVNTAVILQNNAYKNIVIAISSEIAEDPSLIDKIKVSSLAFKKTILNNVLTQFWTKRYCKKIFSTYILQRPNIQELFVYQILFRQSGF